MATQRATATASPFFPPADPLIGYTSADVQKPLPGDLSFEALFGPKPEHEYFARAGAHPFRPTASGFDLRNAWWLADAALLAYVRDEVTMREALERAGLPDVVLVERDATYCFVARAADFAMVSFRGTDVRESRHLKADAKFWYAHVGALKFLDHDGRLLQEAGSFRRTVSSAVGHLARIREVVPRWLSGERNAIRLDQLVDHSPLHYAIRVWNAYARGRP